MKSVILAAVAAAIPVFAHAATVTQSFSFSGSSTEFTEALNGFGYFDMGGTLDSVTLSYNASASGTVSAGACALFADCEPATFSLSLSGGGLFAGVTDGASDGTGITNATDANQFGSYSVSIADTLTLATAGFTGTGTFGGLGFTGDYLAYFLDEGSSYSGTVTLTYEYTPSAVPLPASLPLALGGIGLLGLMGRRRSA